MQLYRKQSYHNEVTLAFNPIPKKTISYYELNQLVEDLVNPNNRINDYFNTILLLLPYILAIILV